MPRYFYERISGLTRVVQILLGVSILVSLFGIWSAFSQIRMMKNGFDDAEGLANDKRERVVAIATAATFVVTAFFFGKWIMRGHNNIRALEAHGLNMRPGWAVAYFFSPVFALWRPYRGMKDLWKGSKNAPDWMEQKSSFLLVIWWLLWLPNTYGANTILRSSMGWKGRMVSINGSYIEMASGALHVLLCIAAFFLVTGIAHNLKRQRMALRDAEEATSPA